MKILFKTLLGLFILTISLILSAKQSEAVYNPLSVPNNKYGIYVLNTADLEKAANLVNSNGGDWGYVTLVIRKDEMVNSQWQDIFDKLRRLHLIPIVRIATIQDKNGWQVPDSDDIDDWADFLDSLNWVIKNRYIIIGNEPNHASEWGGKIDPEGYSDYYIEFAKALKNKSEDFFVIPAGLDASAPNNETHMSETTFLTRVLEANEDYFNYVDGWSSHSYPNPEFAGSAYDTGRGTVRTFEWELDYLKSLGIEKDLPVFITETGWAHSGVLRRDGIPDEEYISDNIKIAFENAWNNDRIVAVTPFVLNYKEEPFEKFSWVKSNGRDNYKFYDEVVNIKKHYGYPIQVSEGEFVAELIPEIIGESDYKVGIALAKNTGQSIWYKDFSISYDDGENIVEITTPIFSDIEPGHQSMVYFRKLEKEHAELFALLLNIPNHHFIFGRF
jgi:hypothetical protein